MTTPVLCIFRPYLWKEIISHSVLTFITACQLNIFVRQNFGYRIVVYFQSSLRLFGSEILYWITINSLAIYSLIVASTYKRAILFAANKCIDNINYINGSLRPPCPRIYLSTATSWSIFCEASCQDVIYRALANESQNLTFLQFSLQINRFFSYILNTRGISAAVLPRYLSNFRAIGKV